MAHCSGYDQARTNFSDPQGGKGSCDQQEATIKNHVKAYLNSGSDVETASQMKRAIEWLRDKLTIHQETYFEQCARVNKLRHDSKMQFYANLTDKNADNQHVLF